MCMLLFRKPNAVIPEEHLKNSYLNNTDGAGFAFPDGQGRVTIDKGMFTLEEFLKKYNEIPADKPLIIHTRFKTSGDDGLLNCHPFGLCPDENGKFKFALAHNGCIGIKLHKTQDGRTFSDTGTFAHLVIEPMLSIGVPPSKSSFSFLIEQSIGSNNKVAIMSGDGSVEIYNESSGEWNKENTIWYSNTGYKYSRVRVYNHSSFDDDWNDRFLGSKKNQDDSKSGNGGCSGGDCGNNSTTDIDDKKEFSDEIELEINFCIKEMSFSRKDAIAYLVYEGVLEEDEATGEIKESDSNYSVVGM